MSTVAEKAWHKLVAEAGYNAWYIWSFEHDAWWMPDSNGYTSCLEEAGVYTAAEAADIVRNANAHGEINETTVPVYCFRVHTTTMPFVARSPFDDQVD